jgi:hypothetical protein
MRAVISLVRLLVALTLLFLLLPLLDRRVRGRYDRRRYIQIVVVSALLLALLLVLGRRVA